MKNLGWIDGTLDSWNYVFIDWLRNNPTSVVSTGTTKNAGPTAEDVPNHTVNDDGTVTLENIGVVKILPKEPCWIVQRLDTGEKWCLLCGKVFDSWGVHQDSITHKKKIAAGGISWMDYSGFGFLITEGGLEQETPLSKTPAASTSASSSGAPASSSGAPVKLAPWGGPVVYQKESKQAYELGSSEPIYRIRSKAVRINIDRDDMPVNAVWLVHGRPGYLVHKEDSAGEKEDWREPFCLVCGSYGTEDHLVSVKHLEKAAQATYNVNAKGYGEVLSWIEKDAEEVIH